MFNYSSRCLVSFGRISRFVHTRAYPRRSSSQQIAPVNKSFCHFRKRCLSTSQRDYSTIYALSTAPGRAAIAVIRCSGHACLDIYKSLCPGALIPKPRRATLRTLYGAGISLTCREVLDSGSIVLYFPGPKTVTGEDVLEFHVHGGPAVVKAVLAAISQTNGTDTLQSSIRYAEPGEFTRRAFYNHRLDLTQVEALGDTLSAETEQQRQIAVRGVSNTLNQRYETWRHLLLQARGELEALIDFSEDQHFDESPSELTESVSRQIVDLRRRIQASIENAAKGELLRHGIKIALLGAPNAGKSSLLNMIVGRDAAIVSSEAGTTRDVIEVNVDIGGYFCKFGDLAGLRAGGSKPSSERSGRLTVGDIEIEGIKRAKKRAHEADVVVVILEVEHDPQNPLGYSVKIDPEVAETLLLCDLLRQRIVFAVNKVDLLSRQFGGETQLPLPELPPNCKDAPIFYISCIDSSRPAFIQPLLNGLTEVFSSLTAASSVDQVMHAAWDESLGASERQRLLLLETRKHLDEFLDCVGCQTMSEESEEVDIVIAAESLRGAAQALGKITGRGEAGDVEEVLGVVFEKFCVGK